MRRSNADRLPRASSLSSIDSIMSPSRMSCVDNTTANSTRASTEPSDFVRGLDPKIKRLSSGRGNDAEPEVVHPQLPLSATPNWPRTDKGWTGMTTTHDATRSFWGSTGPDKEDISSTMSDPGPIWDSEPKWDTEPYWNGENRIELPGPQPEEDEEENKEFLLGLMINGCLRRGSFLVFWYATILAKLFKV